MQIFARDVSHYEGKKMRGRWGRGRKAADIDDDGGCIGESGDGGGGGGFGVGATRPRKTRAGVDQNNKFNTGQP
jgi:hypothetical protein